ncbi:hypothetical protein HQ487_03195 [Candidatus Uhrbacteria bacterium]|nr:hypothetical protein [Candidatus Uhrbacteria bacterium]
MKILYSLCLFFLILSPLSALAQQPEILSDYSWINGLATPSRYTHVRDGYVEDISYEAYFNRYRERLDVPRLRISTDLQESAAAHAAYLATNGVGSDPHGEIEGKVGFTGESILSRCWEAGYSEFCTEVQAGGASDGDGYSAIDALMMTPYHRQTMMYPYFTEVGCALDSGYFVCDIGYALEDYGKEWTQETSPMIYPYDGQVISTTFYVSENPMPYPEYAYQFIGPTFMYWPLGEFSWDVSVALYDLTAQSSITTIVSLDLDDEHADGAIFFNPIEPLSLDHEYAVHVEGETLSGPFDVSWTVKTQKSSKIDFPNGDEVISYDSRVHWAGETGEYLVTTPDGGVRALIDRLEGWIMLAVDRAGEAYYIDPLTKARYYLRDGSTAYEFLRTFGLGITTMNLEQIPEAGSGETPGALAKSLAGRIMLQVDAHGEAWYIHPETYERHYMADGNEAYRIMRELSEGTLYEWISEIPEGVAE